MIFVDYRSMSGHYKFMLTRDSHITDTIFVEEEKKLFPNSFSYLMYKLHYSSLNNVVKLPFKNIWFRFFVPPTNNPSKQYCFILAPSIISRLGLNFIKYLHSRFKCKVVLVIGDTIESYTNGFDIDDLQQHFDMVCTYNPVDAQKYNLLLHPSFVYNLEISNLIPFNQRKNDVFFIGQEKGRGNQIVEIYNKCKSYGLKCDFNIVGNTSSPHIEGIHYCEWISFEKVFDKMKETKCILNILQPGALGVTQRDTEAYNLGCYLITNNKADELNSIFNEGQVVLFENIDKEFAKCVKERNEQFPRRENSYSLDHFYNWIEESLQQ